MSVLGLNYFVFCLLLLFMVLYFTKSIRNEGFFGMSPGTMDQLASTRAPAPTSPTFMTYDPSNELSFTRQTNTIDQELEDYIQQNLTKQGLKNMTESGYVEGNSFSPI
jgi:hypothetical protein